MKMQAGSEYLGEILIISPYALLGADDIMQKQQLTRSQLKRGDELALAMQSELRLSGLAQSPQLASHLRLLSFGSQPGQVFAAFLLGGDDSAFLGWHVESAAAEIRPIFDLKIASEVALQGSAGDRWSLFHLQAQGNWSVLHARER